MRFDFDILATYVTLHLQKSLKINGEMDDSRWLEGELSELEGHFERLTSRDQSVRHWGRVIWTHLYAISMDDA